MRVSRSGQPVEAVGENAIRHGFHRAAVAARALRSACAALIESVDGRRRARAAEAGADRGAAGARHHRLRRAAVVLQRAEIEIGVRVRRIESATRADIQIAAVVVDAAAAAVGEDHVGGIQRVVIVDAAALVRAVAGEGVVDERRRTDVDVLPASVNALKLAMPPPALEALLSDTVLSMRVSGPRFQIAPPLYAAVLPDTVQSLSVRMPPL